MNLMGVKCGKCGLIQMAKDTCKSCGAPLANPLTAAEPREKNDPNPVPVPKPMAAEAGPGENLCCECGRSFSPDEMIQYGESSVCGGCKPTFVQKLKQGMNLPGVMEYAGFWIRLGAKFIDGLILGIASIAITMGAGMFLLNSARSADSTEVIAVQLIMTLFQYVVAAAYTTWFIGKFGATPGKMACKIKVVTADGDRVSFARAFGRHFAEYLSALILMIGYLMSAFDAEKRSLHDRMCNTRVIKA